jgi:hypothetical protein
MEIQLHAFLTLALNRVKWSESYSVVFISGERALSTHSTAGCVGPHSQILCGGKEKSFPPTGMKYMYLNN